VALSLQRKLELAGDLSKVQPLLQRLHVLKKPKPKQRHHVRNVILVSSAVGACAVVLAVVFRRRGCQTTTVPGNGWDAQTGSPTQDTGDPEPIFDAGVGQPTTA
jgi:hypothetical protein